MYAYIAALKILWERERGRQIRKKVINYTCRYVHVVCLFFFSVARAYVISGRAVPSTSFFIYLHFFCLPRSADHLLVQSFIPPHFTLEHKHRYMSVGLRGIFPAVCFRFTVHDSWHTHCRRRCYIPGFISTFAHSHFPISVYLIPHFFSLHSRISNNVHIFPRPAAAASWGELIDKNRAKDLRNDIQRKWRETH